MITIEDLIKVQEHMDKMGVPNSPGDRFIFIPGEKPIKIKEYIDQLKDKIKKATTSVPPEYIDPKNRK